MEKDFKLKDNPELNEYIKEFDEDVKLTLANIREKSLLVSTIRSKWLAYYMKEKENLARIKKVKAEILKKKVASSANKSILRLKTEDSISQNDETIKRLNFLQDKTNSNIEFMERGFNILDNFPFVIKNTIDILKLEKM